MKHTKHPVSDVPAAITCDICGKSLDLAQAHYLPTIEAAKDPNFWNAMVVAMEKNHQSFPSCHKAVIELVLMVTGHDRGIKFCGECDQRMFPKAPPAIVNKWDNPAATNPGQAFWNGRMSDPIFVSDLLVEEFQTAHFHAVNNLATHLVVKWAKQFMADHGTASKPPFKEYFRQSFEALGYEAILDLEAGQYSLVYKP